MSSSGGADTAYLYGIGRALALRSGQGDAFSRDAHGSALAEGEGADLARAAGYDEFGRPVATSAAGLLDELLGAPGQKLGFGYRGETTVDGLVNLRARHYAPGLGQFTTVDPLDTVEGSPVQGPFSYVDNDPLNRVDPLGLRSSDVDFAGAFFIPWLLTPFHNLAVELVRLDALSSGLVLGVDFDCTLSPQKLRPDLCVREGDPSVVTEFGEMKYATPWSRAAGLKKVDVYQLAIPDAAPAGGLSPTSGRVADSRWPAGPLTLNFGDILTLETWREEAGLYLYRLTAGPILAWTAALLALRALAAWLVDQSQKTPVPAPRPVFGGSTPWYYDPGPTVQPWSVDPLEPWLMPWTIGPGGVLLS